MSRQAPAWRPVRRVVTGVDAEGRSRVASDIEVAPFVAELLSGAAFWRLWGADGPVTAPNPGDVAPPGAYFPPPGGARFEVFALAPAGAERVSGDRAEDRRRVEAELPGLLDVMERDAPGMHATATVDLVFVLDGEVSLELDDGAEVHLRAGDCVVQNGTRHAWRNHAEAPARLLVCLLGAHPAAPEGRAGGLDRSSSDR